MPKGVDVAIGVLVDRQGGHLRILIARRLETSVLGGFWELPGGKVAPGESVTDALVREFEEELGVTVCVGDALALIEHTYEHAHVRLHPFYCTLATGELRDLHVAEHRWVRPQELGDFQFPPANATLIAHLMAALSEPA